MLMFFGKPKGVDDPVDENASRAARIEILREKFYAWKQWPDFEPSKFRPVATQYLLNKLDSHESVSLSDYGAGAQRVVLNAHGSDHSLSRKDAAELADIFIRLGVKQAGTAEIWLAACNTGLQTQNNEGPEPLACQLLSEFRTRYEFDVKVYAPRAILTYTGGTEVDVGSGQKKLKYADATIVAPERAYPFQEGWVLAHI